VFADAGYREVDEFFRLFSRKMREAALPVPVHSAFRVVSAVREEESAHTVEHRLNHRNKLLISFELGGIMHKS
jgi:hypothetical protein